MDELKKSIRPKLNLQKASTETECFQNEVLRPILKLQHTILLQIIVQFSKKQKTDIQQLSEDKFVSFVSTSIQRNTVLRNQYIGIIIGQLTDYEFKTYAENTSEFNKRILTMIQKRLVDSLIELKTIK